MSNFANSFKYCKYINNILKKELGFIYIKLCNFYKAFFGSVANFETIFKVVFKKYIEGNNLHFCIKRKWRKWPKDTN